MAFIDKKHYDTIKFDFNATKTIGPDYNDKERYHKEQNSRTSYSERNIQDFGYIVRCVSRYEEDGYTVSVTARLYGHHRTVYSTREDKERRVVGGKWLTDDDYTGFNLKHFCEKFDIDATTLEQWLP